MRNVQPGIAVACAAFMFTAWACFAKAPDDGQAHFVDGANPRASDSGPGTRRAPWKSLTAVDAHRFGPGDTVFFARGSSYEGGLTIRDSGAPGRPITLSGYGSGAAPRFTNPDSGRLNGNVIRITGSYVVVDGLHFHDGAPAPGGGTAAVLRTGDVFIDKGAEHNTIRNSEVSNSPIGFSVHGEHALITRNHLHDCNRALRPPGWGPIAIMLGNANIEVSHNRITNYIWTGGTFGADGGAIEVDPRLYQTDVHDIEIHHNYSYGNEGFVEITKATKRINVRYNFSNDYQQFVFYWDGTDSVVENNTVLRVLPKNSVTDVVFSFALPGNTIRDNIFVVTAGRQVFSDNGTQVYKKGDYAGQKRYNNIYFSMDGSRADPCGLALAEGEKVADPLFVAYGKQDYRLKRGSPAIDAGSDARPGIDLDGKKVPAGKARDAGAYEYGGR